MELARLPEPATNVRTEADDGHAEPAHLVLERVPDPIAEANDERILSNVLTDKGHTELARPVLEYRANATDEADDGPNPSDMASQWENEQFSRVLVDPGTIPTAQNDQRCCHCIAQ